MRLGEVRVYIEYYFSFSYNKDFFAIMKIINIRKFHGETELMIKTSNTVQGRTKAMKHI